MLFCYKSSFMQAIQDCVRHGYSKYTTGVIPAEKLPGFFNKMEKKYSVNQHRQTEYRRRKKGLGNARFYAYPVSTTAEEPRAFFFMLFVSEGTHPAHHEEQLLDLTLRKNRLQYDQFELVLDTSKGSDKPAWTWRLTAESRKKWEEIVVKAARNKNDAKLRQVIHSISKMPGFGGINKDRKYLYQRLMKEWKRHHKKSEEQPSIPRITWLRRIEWKKVTQVQRFISEMSKHDRTAAEQMRRYLANKAKRRNSAPSTTTTLPNKEKKQGLVLRIIKNKLGKSR